MKDRHASPETLIFTQSLDTHPVFISAALDLLSHPSEIVVLDTMLSQGGFSLSDEDGDRRIVVRGQNVDVPLSALRSVWNRRRPIRFAEPAHMHPADLPFLESSGFSFAKSVSLIGEDLFSVNPARGILYGGDKYSQMHAARRAGFFVPRTRITNDAASVRDLIRQEGRICVKSYTPINWMSEGVVYAPWTTKLDSTSVFEDESVELCPMIYQAIVEKEFEVRLTVFGAYYSATRIDSQANAGTSLDWRKDQACLENLRDISLPDSVIQSARDVLKSLGLRFGTFDLAFNAEKGWVFFEVNESGQFLWQEEFCRDARLCEPFARFLVSCDETFTFDPSGASAELSFESLKTGIQDTRHYRKMDALTVHLANNPFILNEDMAGRA